MNKKGEMRRGRLLLCFFSLSVLVFSVWGCYVYHEADAEARLYDVSPEEHPGQDSSIQALIAPYKKELDAEMNQVIGRAAQTLYKGSPESTLGNWAADAVLAQARQSGSGPVDFAVVNYGGIRIPNLPEGDITVGKVFELMPFDNALVILELEGATVRRLFQRIAEYGGWPVSRGVVCRFTKDGKLIDATLGGQPVEEGRSYRLAVSDYVANGGDNCFFLKGIPQIHTGLLFRDAFLDQIRALTAKGQLVDAALEGRMLLEE